MAMDYTIYENWYKYMSGVINQIQGGSGYSGAAYTNQAASSDQSFAETFLNILQRMTRSVDEETAGGTVSSTAQTGSAIQTGSETMDAIFEEAAQLYNVPLNLLKAIGKAESGFDANAVSAAGAQGVMQLMPATARSLGVEDPFDARSNIMGGAKYISQMLSRYNGDIELALAAYNAGSGNVAKYGGVPPFTETRNYISRIKGYMNSQLTTGKTVEKRASGTDEEESGTFLNYWDLLRAGIGTQDLSLSGLAGSGISGLTGSRTSGSGISGLVGSRTSGSSISGLTGSRTSGSGISGLTQQNAQYMADMMRLQMISKAGTLSTLSDSSGDSDGNDFFL